LFLIYIKHNCASSAARGCGCGVTEDLRSASVSVERGADEPGSWMAAELASQPECWLRAVRLAPEVAGLLPRRGERVAVVGCGTSWFIGQSYAAAREAAGSGTTTEILDLLAQISGRLPVVAITADESSPVARGADAVITLDFADEKSVVQTRFATTELALLLAPLGHDVAAAAAAARRVLASPVPELLVGARQFTFLGTGWTCGLASEAALKLREAAGMWTESYPAMEYRHGPIAVTGPGSVVWMLGAAPAGLSDEITLAGGTPWPGDDDPLADLVAVHQLAAALGRSRGLDPDRPRNLTRSVILARP
jgi:fructoselysine-6-P-deglycase FrlB-like protein